MLCISQYFIKANILIVSWIKKFIKIISYPFICIFKWIKKIFIGPISFICINLRKKTSKIYKKILYHQIKNNKTLKK